MTVSATDYINASQSTTADECQQPSTTSTTSSDFASLLSQLMSQVNLTCPDCGETNTLDQYDISIDGMDSTSSSYSAATLSSLYYNSSISGTSSSGLSSDPSQMDIEWPSGQDVSEWDQTVSISNVEVNDGKISWDESGDRETWEQTTEDCNANAWLIKQNDAGQWEAGTWEWLRDGQTTKLTENIEEMYEPESGETVGIMVAGITRNAAYENVEARSNIVWITWP